ncbi:MAG: WYL domain-containing protein [Chitinophagales bacterium]
MSKRTGIERYNIIINQLRKKKSSFDEIYNVLKRKSEIESYDFTLSKRTFKRDLQDIFAIYQIEILFDFSQKVYYIDQQEGNINNEKILEAFDIFNALNLSSSVNNFIHFDNRKPQGTVHLSTIIQAIKNRNILHFTHQKFSDSEITNRVVQPLALKESHHRWYLVAKDMKDEIIKTFGLDRIIESEITKKKFVYPKDFDVNDFFKYSFGVTNVENKEPSDIVLSFEPYEGKFIKTLPLHHSQKIITDTAKELRIELKLYITNDLVMEILSYGNKVKVIQPKQLITEIRNTLKKMNY